MMSVSNVDTVQLMYFEMTANKRPVNFTGRLFECGKRAGAIKTHLSGKNSSSPCLVEAIIRVLKLRLFAPNIGRQAA
jgi:hypothetical protein